MRKLLMNCDQVFDVLTRGPFPTGDDSDEAVERHLRACHECRQLAEALQPAVELLHESLAREETADLPEYQGLLAVERSVATAEQMRPRPLGVRQLARPPVAPRRQLTAITVAQFAVALVMVLAASSLVWNLAGTSQHTLVQSEFLAGMLAPEGSTLPVRLDDRGLMSLASLNLPGKCFLRDVLIDVSGNGSPPPAVAAIGRDVLHCCTECHHAGQARRPALRTIATLQQSCLACHSL